MGHGRQFHGSGHVREASPGKNALFLSIHLPHLPFGIPSRYGTSVCFTPLSIPNWPYAVSVRQVRDLPAPSFGFHLTMLPLMFGHDFPTTRAIQGLSLLRVRPCRAHQKQGKDFLPALFSAFSRYFILAISSAPIMPRVSFVRGVCNVM